MKLAVLDQVPIFADAGPAVAAQESVRLAQHAERLGYHRFWVAEHHGTACGSGSPEVLVAAAAAATSRIRVGSGAVLLPYYEPIKVATTFNLLARLFPGRIDLGVGRGPGAEPGTARLLAPADGASYGARVAALIDLVYGPGAASYLPEATPAQIWLMGSGPDGALTAARHGLPFCLAQFVHDVARPELLDLYRDNFAATRPDASPHAAICVRVACADDPADARALAGLLDALAAALRPGAPAGPGYLPSWRDLRRCPSGASRPGSLAMLAGSPAEVGHKVGELLDAYRPDELAVTTACPDFDLRVRTFELVSEMALEPAAGIR